MYSLILHSLDEVVNIFEVFRINNNNFKKIILEYFLEARIPNLNKMATMKQY